MALTKKFRHVPLGAENHDNIVLNTRAGTQRCSVSDAVSNSDNGHRGSPVMAKSPVTPSAPVLTAQTAAQTWLGGKAASFALPSNVFNDPQGRALSYTASLSSGLALPSWLIFNAATRTFSGTAPGVAQTLNLKVTATDASGLSAAETFSLAVIGAPVVTAQTAAQTWLGGKLASFVLPSNVFNDPQGQALRYTASLASGLALPSWLTFNAATRTFSGTAPGAAQTVALKVTATDASGLSAAETFSLAVVGAPVLKAQTAAQTWLGGKAASFALPSNVFNDPQGQALSYTASLANGLALPSWLTFDAATRTFSGTAPLLKQALSLRVTATDTSGLAAMETFTVNIAGAPVVSLQTPRQAWVEGKAFSLGLPAGTITDPQGQALTYSASLADGQALPSWLVFNAANRSFSGTAPGSAGTFSIQVKATDTYGLFATETFLANIAAAPLLAQQTAAQTWIEGGAVSMALAANSFTDPQGQALTYSAVLSSGAALPAGLICDPATGTISGTAPAYPQTLAIKITATDTSGLAASETLAVNVLRAPALASASLGLSADTAFSLGFYAPDNPNGNDPKAMAAFKNDYDTYVKIMGTRPTYYTGYTDFGQDPSKWAANAGWSAWSWSLTGAYYVGPTSGTIPVVGLPLASNAGGWGNVDNFYKAIIAGKYDANYKGVIDAWAKAGYRYSSVSPGL